MRQGDYYKFDSKLGYMVVSEATLGYQGDPFSIRKQTKKLQMGVCVALMSRVFIQSF